VRNKSSPEQLRGRGFADERDLERLAGASCAELLLLLQSGVPAERTIAAKLLQRHPALQVIPALCAALAVEGKLYPKLAICECLVGMGAPAADEVAKLLGRVGDNQHRVIPDEVFRKSSYPLPRDIAARTLGHMGIAAWPALVRVLEQGPLEAVREAIDAMGFAGFYATKAPPCSPLIRALQVHGSDLLVRWKIATALQGFLEGEGTLRVLSVEDADARVREEAQRSLQRLSARKAKG